MVKMISAACKQTTFFFCFLGFFVSKAMAFRVQPLVLSPAQKFTPWTSTFGNPLSCRQPFGAATWQVRSASSDGASGEVEISPLSNIESAVSEREDSSSRSIGQRLRAYFRPPADGLTTRQRLAKMGLSVLLSYGWVSNMSYCVSVSLAWYIFTKQTRLSPLAPGQWKPFLAVYAGFYLFNNIVRPARATLAVAVSPQFDRFVAAVQERLRISKPKAVFLTVVLFNVVGTLSFMTGGIALAALASGVPIFPPSV